MFRGEGVIQKPLPPIYNLKTVEVILKRDATLTKKSYMEQNSAPDPTLEKRKENLDPNIGGNIHLKFFKKLLFQIFVLLLHFEPTLADFNINRNILLVILYN